MRRILLLSNFALFIVVASFNSCKKEEPDTEAQSAVDNSICESEFSRVGTMVVDHGIKTNGIKLPGGCPTASLNPADSADGFPKTLKLDFGSGCTDNDGKFRKGLIYATFTDSFNAVARTPKIILKFQNYEVNGVTFECDSILISRDAAYTFTTNVVGGNCWNSSWHIDWSSTRTMTQTAGTGDTDATNDVFEFTGSVVGKNRNGKPYTANITIPLQKKAGCKWIDKGRIDLTPQGHATRTIDYGDGTKCDNDVTLTINGNEYHFKLD